MVQGQPANMSSSHFVATFRIMIVVDAFLGELSGPLNSSTVIRRTLASPGRRLRFAPNDIRGGSNDVERRRWLELCAVEANELARCAAFRGSAERIDSQSARNHHPPTISIDGFSDNRADGLACVRVYGGRKSGRAPREASRLNRSPRERWTLRQRSRLYTRASTR